MIPCSAATVIGSVCDSDTGGLAFATCLRKAVENEPLPYPQTGRFPNSSKPPEARLKRPVVSLLTLLSVERSRLSEPPTATAIAIAAIAPAAQTASVQRRLQRSAASVASPATSAA